MNRVRAWALAALGALTSACAGGFRDSAGRTLNALAAASQSGATAILEAECSAELRALHHTGSWRAGHCERTDAPRAATAEETAALAATRAQWARVATAYRLFADAHEAARATLGPTGSEDSVPAALARLAGAYAVLIDAAQAVGVTVPAFPVGADAGAD